MCANGIRAFYKYLRDTGHTKADEIGVETLGGVVRPRWAGPGQVTVDMGLPILAPAKIPTTLASGDGPVLDVPIELPSADGVTAAGGGFGATAAGSGAEALAAAGADTSLWPGGPSRLLASSVSMGNPHCVIEVEDVDAVPLAAIGPLLEHHPAFPNRVNVELIEIVSRDRIRQRTWERGTGETLACGSGACAVAVSAMLRGVVDREVTVELRGGELRIAWADAQAPVLMTGPAVTVFTGEWPLQDDLKDDSQDDAADGRPQRA
jgi:diaminopimelate epimerase